LNKNWIQKNKKINKIMFTILSLVTSVKDYIEIVHKLVETNSLNSTELVNYYDLGALVTYAVMIGKDTIFGLLSFKWLQNIASFPLIIPDVASAMISEISVLDGYFHNAFTFLETRIYYGDNNLLFYGIEKFSIGLINSIFLCLPTSTAHIITLRRFVMQGIEAGYLAGLGTLAGNILWIGSILFGLRFIVIPWLSLDILRYALGFLLLIKYMWDSYSEKRTVLEDISKWKIFLLNFLLAFTEQATIYPFLSNISFGSDSSIIESFPTTSVFEFGFIHLCYLGGLVIGSLSLLQLTCWFWENPAFNIYMWTISSFKLTGTLSQRFLNICFLYLTMFFAISNISYFGLDYTLTNPLGLLHEDRLVDQKMMLETSFLNTKASDRNTRRNRGRHGRRERWKRRVRRYRTFDASLYDQGVYDLFTIEDLNYGFDRFWLRRKIRNHRVRFRFFPGPWMRSFKKQLARPRLESFMGPRVEFFRILFEQAYHPEFHEFREVKNNKLLSKNSKNQLDQITILNNLNSNKISYYSEQTQKSKTQNLLKEHSALRKFVRKFKTRSSTAKILFDIKNTNLSTNGASILFSKTSTKPIYSKRWKRIFSRISHDFDNKYVSKGPVKKSLTDFYSRTLNKEVSVKPAIKNYFFNLPIPRPEKPDDFIEMNSDKRLSKKERQILRYKSFLKTSTNSQEIKKSYKNFKLENLSKDSNWQSYKALTLLHPIDFYLQKEQGFRKKMKFYGASVFRNFGIENNAPYYRIMMKKFFYYYKPTLRWERTMRTATMRKARRKGKRIPRKLNVNLKTQMLAKNSYTNEPLDDSGTLANFETKSDQIQDKLKTKIQRPTHFYSLVSKRATRYRYQIYKDVLQHWYYTPFNRLLLKLDVDAFIRRQPISHFLTKNEEKLLHFKRYLLTDYYNTLRWYTYMQHYDSMKTNIGKTKSFSSRAYNQQFFGTFKKIRHLFAITPSFTENNVLKFDQPLFKEFKDSEQEVNKDASFYNPSVIHEELLADESLYKNDLFNKNLPSDLANQSTIILKEYLKQATPIRKKYIKDLLEENNYSELTSFLFKGQKIRGSNAVTNEDRLINQEKNYLLSSEEKEREKEILKNFFQTKLFPESLKNANNSTSFSTDQSYLWISLMKKSRNILYNQEALKNYVSGRVEKIEKQKKRQQKLFKNRLNNMKNWSNLLNTNTEDSSLNQISGLTSSLQKAIKEGIYYQTSGFISGTKLEKSNLRNNLPKILTNLGVVDKSSAEFKNTSNREVSDKELKNAKNISLNLKNHLKNRIKSKALQTLDIERTVRKKIISLNKELKNETGAILTILNPSLLSKIVDRTLIPFSFFHRKIQHVLKSSETQLLVKPVKTFLGFFQHSQFKNLDDWKRRETIFSTRKKIRRKIYRVLDQKNQLEKFSTVNEFENVLKYKNSTPLRQKQDNLTLVDSLKKQNPWNSFESQKFNSFNNLQRGLDKPIPSSRLFSEIFEKNFKRKRSRSRRYRRFKGRGPIKKHTLAEKLKRQFKLLKRYGEKQEGKDKKMEIFQMITKRKYDANSSFERRETKQRRTRQSKHRYWKKHKRQHYLQVKRKQRKRRRSAISKLRVLNKEFKRLKSNFEIQNWWWSSFLPNFKATTETFWTTQKNQQIQQELSKLSPSEILQRDSFHLPKTTGYLQIGNQDFKPLILPEALSIRENLTNKGLLHFGKDINENKLTDQYLSEINSSKNIHIKSNLNTLKTTDSERVLNNLNTEENLVSRLSENLLNRNWVNNEGLTSKSNSETKKMLNANPIPFYAGWDEGLRKFVVTNRLLSRKEAGYSMNFLNKSSGYSATSIVDPLKDYPETSKLEFTKSPLQGMNAATTLYWQIPFTTYDPDQFFALGLDGFSPLGWRLFDFKHSKQTTKPMLVKNIFYNSGRKLKNKSILSYNLQLEILNHSLDNKANQWKNSFEKENKQNSKNRARKIQKRQKRVKKHPRPPVWFPSGPLTNQVLPVHYIYVFYKRTRLPRDRYIGRRLRRSDDNKVNYLKSNFTKTLDFTLRKRVKPIRKYHRKRTSAKTKENSLIVRRRPFKGFENDSKLSRPIFKTRSTTQMDILNSSLLKTKQRKKNLTNKQNFENLRIRQLRRRIQRQVLRPIWRYKPRSGGLVWPGDYLRLETVKAPTLKSTQIDTEQTQSVQIRKKKRRNIQEWQIQPKKYLLKKHNLKVLKKKLQNSQNLNNYHERLAQINLMI
jgi:hypothetical protein